MRVASVVRLACVDQLHCALIEPSASAAERFDSQTGDAASGAGGKYPWAKPRLVRVALYRYTKLRLPCFAGIPIASMLASVSLESTSFSAPLLLPSEKCTRGTATPIPLVEKTFSEKDNPGVLRPIFQWNVPGAKRELVRIFHTGLRIVSEKASHRK